ncbi:TetR/AcrR family transcriptional regulator [Nocardia bovistercoris]|uniref:TetR/AcrR family transcriptional regulator n=1 Tax=Nocardia bovistercoris TaxID=2785916 RepID=A0A931N6F3_9NOCA|nr:TetR/AcrR family transcriptional regulator [Nocardia bovistercoris]
MTSKRRYATGLRAQHTAVTRERILEAARHTFLEHGYLGATISGIAEHAEVSVQTIYNVVGNKAALFKTVYDVMLAGDDEPVPMAQRPMFQAMINAPSGRECLAHYTAISRVLAERALPLVSMALAQAATGDAELREFTDTIENERAVGTANTARHIAQRFGLRDGVDVEEAADTLWALTAPELADRLVNRRGWGWDRYQSWLHTAAADALLGPETSSRTVAPEATDD